MPSEVKNKDLKGANIFAGSDYHKMYCSYNDDTEKIVCVLSGGLTEFAGQTGIIYLAGQVFYVTIPDKGLPPGHSGTGSDDETCPEDDEECEEEEGPRDPGDPGTPVILVTQAIQVIQATHLLPVHHPKF